MSRLLRGGIARRLLLGLLATALLPLLLVTVLNSLNASRALRERVVDNLRSLVNAKAAQVELYAWERKQDVTSLARTPAVVQAMEELQRAASGADPNSATLARVRDRIRPFLAGYAAQASYRDMLLIASDGRVLFALERTDQIGRNYRRDPDSRLARVFDRTATLLETEISDFQPDPDTGLASAYIAAPIFDGQIISGVVVFRLDSRRLYQILTERRGLGQSGETLVGRREADTIRVTAPLRHDPDAAFQRVLAVDGPDPLVRAVRGEQGVGVLSDYRGVESIAAWRYLPSLHWGIVVKQDTAEAFASIHHQQRLALISAGVSAALVVLVAVWLARSLAAPLLTLTGAVRAVSAGDLRARAPDSGRGDEIGVLTRGFNHMAGELAQLVDSLEARIHERTASLETARQEAERANHAKSVFLANMSHELRTPLNAILGFTQVLERDRELSARHREHLGIIDRSGQHLLGLINDVLAVSKIEAGQMRLQPAPFDLSLLLQSLEEMFRLPTRQKNLQFLFEVADDLPQHVLGDEGKLRQVLINLLSNAVKFTSEGGVGLRARYGDGHLYVEVEDTGAGIDPAELDQLFKPFVQTQSGATVKEGTGLGLAISRQFVEMMDGDIRVRSEPGRGSIFAFQVALPTTEAAPITEERRVLDLAPGITPPRVLVVDDKADNRELLKVWLDEVGFQVREAADGAEALAVWRDWRPQLVWMDMRMPVMDGYEATRRLRAEPGGRDTVVIALTASAFAHERSVVMEAGCDDFVPKPVREATIFEKMREHLGLEYLYDDQTPTAPADTPVALDTAMLRALPGELLSALSEAAISADMEAVQALIQEIPAGHEATARALETLLAEFRLDILHELLERDR